METKSSDQLILHSSVESFAQATVPFLEKSEAENGLLLGMIAVCLEDPDPLPFLAEIRGPAGILGATFYRERNLIVTNGPEEMWAEVAAALRDASFSIPGVIGPASASEAFAHAWASLTGCQQTLSMDQGLYQLTKVSHPAGVPGRARLVREEELEILVEFCRGFYSDALPWEMPPEPQLRANAEARIAARSTYFWETNGEPVAMTALARPTARGISVNSVYTPPQFRGRGFGTALVAAVSAEGLARGKEFCVLYTDLQNPTSNAIYQKVGYRRVGHTRNYTFR